MMRWKPSVSSCSAPGASVLAAVFSIGLLLPGLVLLKDEPIVPVVKVLGCESSWLFSSGLNQFLTVRLDEGGKTKRVIARALFGELGVSLFQRLDDGEMLGQRGRHALGASDRELAIAAHVQKDFVGHVDQRRRFRQRDQRLVEGDIGLRIFIDVIL